MNERLKKREEEHLKKIEQKKREKEANKVENEDSDCIMSSFNQRKSQVESKLKLIQLDSGDLVDQLPLLTEAMAQYEELKNLINDSGVYLPAYRLRVAQEALNSLRSLVDEKKELLAPKNKLEFKDVDCVDSFSRNDGFQGMQKQIIVNELSFYGLRNVANSQVPLQLFPSEVNGKDIQLDDISGCTIEIFGAPNTLHISKLTNCKLFSGPTSTSIFVDDCQNCVFQLACQQLRIHTTKDSEFNVHITSRSIIEDSTNLRFGPFDWTYDDLKQHFDIAKIDVSKNNWKKVDDFNWLSEDEPSPNWVLIA